MEYWFSEQTARLRSLPETKRYLYHNIDWSGRCVGLLGARGTGKTTLMLQYLFESFPGSDKALYVSVDHPRFQVLSLYEFGREFSQYGGEILFLDEVHKYDRWASHIKTLYDSCPDLRIIFSGSSLLQLQIQDTDLSRRTVFYHLHGLSLREFLFFRQKTHFPAIDFNDLVENHISYSQQICREIKPLEHFRNYLRYGYYPYFTEGIDVYSMKLNEVVQQVLETDLPFVGHVDIRQISKLKKLIYLLAINVPSQVNIQKLSASTEISRPKVYEYLEYLKKARLLHLIRGGETGYKILSKPDKIFLENPNLAYALADTVNIGTIRETFFVSQVANAFNRYPSLAKSSITTAKRGDFKVLDRFSFEIGGRTKGASQIRGIDRAFIASDDLETGFTHKIPLWLFGFLY